MSYKDTNWIDPRIGKPKDAPCAFLDWNEITRRYIKKTPPVNCDGNCEKCGYNPEVKERRIKKLQEKNARIAGQRGRKADV